MNKKNLLVVILFVYIVVMLNSVSAVEYRVLDDRNTTVMLSKIEKIDNTIDRCPSFFKSTKRDVKWFTSTQDGKILQEKITDLKTTLEYITSRPTNIGFIFQLIIGLMASVVIIIFIIGTILSVVSGSLITLFMVALVSLIIILIKFITDNH